MQIASSKKRIFSFVIDDIIISLFLLAIFYNQIMNLNSAEDIQAFMAANLFTIMLLKVAYHTLFVWQNGMTLGKYIMKIRVISEDGYSGVSFGVAFIRALVRLISEFFFYLGFVMAFFVPNMQTLHDKIGRTLVVDV